MDEIYISERVAEKLAKKQPPVLEAEVYQCFENLKGRFMRDTRAKHETDPPTQWYISATNKGRPLKIVFMRYDWGVVLKSAYDPNSAEQKLYDELNK